MRVAIMGSGGVGGHAGAWVRQAGQDAAFIARGTARRIQHPLSKNEITIGTGVVHRMVDEWEVFARTTCLPAAKRLESAALRDHAKGLLTFADDMELGQDFLKMGAMFGIPPLCNDRRETVTCLTSTRDQMCYAFHSTRRRPMSKSFKTTLLAVVVASLGTASAYAAPSYTASVFATAPTGSSGPDSVTVAAGSVWISYDGSALSSDGSQPAGFSTVARYSMTGVLQNTYQIAGDVDGLKYNPATGMMWATQNQDANSSITLINPITNTLTPLSYAVTSPTQGVDDLVFTANGTFLSTTNPSAATDPTLTKIVPGTTPVQVTTVATAGQTGTNIVTGATNYVPSVVNTDSLKVAPNGDLVQTTGNRDTLLFIHNAGLPTQSFSYLTLTAAGAPVSGTDDSLFITSASGKIFAAVSNTNQVMEIDYSGFTPGTLLASVGSLQEIGFVDQTTGNVTPFVTGLSGIHGLDVVAAVPEPSTYALMLAGLAAVAGIKRRRRNR